MKKIFMMILIGLVILSLNDIHADVIKLKSDCIIQDIKILKIYFDAIHHIRLTLEDAAKKFKCDTCKETPNPYHWRTPKYIFLETAINPKEETVINPKEENEERLMNLYTPFGGVYLLGDVYSKMIKVSKYFLTNMKWELKDVTKQVHVYDYIQEEKKLVGPFPFKKESYEGAGNRSKLYLVVSIGSEDSKIDFFQEDSKEELIVLKDIVLTSKQNEIDECPFKHLSNGKDRF